MASLRHPDTTKLALVMVGLPARGKTYIGRKLARYLCWHGHSTRVFNVGSYRRQRVGARLSSEFFSPENAEGEAQRLEMATAALEDMISWLRGGGTIGIYDATNTTRERRGMVRERCEREGFHVVFIESICDDPRVIEINIRETKLHSPDYVGVEPEDAVRDFRKRIEFYENVYEPVDEDEASYIKLVDVGRQIIINHIQGYLPSRLVAFLMNLHVVPRPVWLTRHGESQFNELGLIGGDPPLTAKGLEYARALADFVRRRAAGDVRVWTSTLRRTIETGSAVAAPSIAWRALDEIDAGICDGMSYAQIAREMPDEFAARASDKFHYRYPRGESYEDVILRLDPVIIELERERRPVLIVAHQAVLRALYAYLMDIPAEACPRLSIPLHTVIQLTPTAYGCDEARFPLEPVAAQGPDSSGVS